MNVKFLFHLIIALRKRYSYLLNSTVVGLNHHQAHTKANVVFFLRSNVQADGFDEVDISNEMGVGFLKICFEL